MKEIERCKRDNALRKKRLSFTKRTVLYETSRLGPADKVERSRGSFYESYKVFCKGCTKPRFSCPQSLQGRMGHL